ncbi:hypothetical protein vseg_011572 [Gypsophila vaccaria]
MNDTTFYGKYSSSWQEVRLNFIIRVSILASPGLPLQSHKNAAGLRNKSLPLDDEQGKYFGKDRGTGTEGYTVQDALGDMEDAEHGEQGQPKQEQEDEVHQSNAKGTISASPGTQAETSHSNMPSNRKTKKARTETIEALKQFSTRLDKMSDVMEAVGEHIGRLANWFQHAADSAQRRIQVTSEVMKIEGLTPTEVLLA